MYFLSRMNMSENRAETGFQTSSHLGNVRLLVQIHVDQTVLFIAFEPAAKLGIDLFNLDGSNRAMLLMSRSIHA